MLSTILISVDTFVTVATTVSSLTLSLTGIGFIAIPLSTGIACELTISDKVISEQVMQMYNNYKSIRKGSTNY